MFSCGNSFDRENDLSLAVSDLPGRVVPPWKFGISPASMFLGALGYGMV